MARDQSTAPHALAATRYWLIPNAQNTSRENTKRTQERWPVIVKYSGVPDGVRRVVAEGVRKRHLWQVERHGQLFFDTSPDYSEQLANLSRPKRLPFTAAELPSEDEESRFPEGKERFAMHRTLERDSSIAKRVKVKRLGAVGKLECEVCSFDFGQMYGSHGVGFIEAHHTVPVAELGGSTKTKASDFALVCSNCHRMLHHGPRLLSIAELRALSLPNES